MALGAFASNLISLFSIIWQLFYESIGTLNDKYIQISRICIGSKKIKECKCFMRRIGEPAHARRCFETQILPHISLYLDAHGNLFGEACDEEAEILMAGILTARLVNRIKLNVNLILT